MRRRLDVPTIGDRVAQIVTMLYFEPEVEPLFHKDSYGYRPGKSALDAVGQARKRCWKFDYVIEFDIKGLFDNIDHELLKKAVRKHAKEPWIELYVDRWVKAPFMDGNGVVHLLHRDAVVELDRGLLPGRQLVGIRWQGGLSQNGSNFVLRQTF